MQVERERAGRTAPEADGRPRLAAAWLLIGCALLPLLWLAWQVRDVPHLGTHHDDAVYLVGAKSLAHTGQYRIVSLPGQFFQTRYPPLYSITLTPAWWIAAELRDALPWALLLTVLPLPLLFGLCLHVWRRFGLTRWQQAVLLALVAFSPWFALFAVSLMSDILGLTLLLGAIVMVEGALDRNSWRWAGAAGVLAGLCYLTRSNLAVLIPATAVLLAVQRRWALAGAFALAALPQAIGWQLWSALHRGAAIDRTSLYYTSYLSDWTHNVTWESLPTLVWLNTDAMVLSCGQVLIFGLDYSVAANWLARFTFFLAVAGTVRLVRRSGQQVYGIFALAFIPLVVIYPVSPVPRHGLPLLPLLAAGLLTEVSTVATMVRDTWRRNQTGERPVAAVMGLLLAGLGWAVLVHNTHGWRAYLPGVFRFHRQLLSEQQPVLAWIREHTPAGARFSAYEDAAFSLRTGRTAIFPPLLECSIGAPAAQELERYFAANRLTHVLTSRHDFYRTEGQRSDCRNLDEWLSKQREFTRVFGTPTATIWAVRK